MGRKLGLPFTENNDDACLVKSSINLIISVSVVYYTITLFNHSQAISSINESKLINIFKFERFCDSIKIKMRFNVTVSKNISIL